MQWYDPWPVKSHRTVRDDQGLAGLTQMSSRMHLQYYLDGGSRDGGLSRVTWTLSDQLLEGSRFNTMVSTVDDLEDQKKLWARLEGGKSVLPTFLRHLFLTKLTICCMIGWSLLWQSQE